MEGRSSIVMSQGENQSDHLSHTTSDAPSLMNGASSSAPRKQVQVVGAPPPFHGPEPRHDEDSDAEDGKEDEEERDASEDSDSHSNSDDNIPDSEILSGYDDDESVRV